MEISTLERLFDEYRARFQPERAAGIEGVVQLHLSGTEGGEWVMEVRGSRLRIERGVHAKPDATVRCRADDWIAVSTGRANPATLLVTGRLKVSGSVSLANRLQRLFRTGD